MQYNTGVLVGRAFALANVQAPLVGPDPARELCELAEGDRMALLLAQARYREFLAGPNPTPEDAQALELLERALDRFDELCPA